MPTFKNTFLGCLLPLVIVISVHSQNCPENCDDGNACTQDICVEGACAHLPRDLGWPCEDDGNLCTTDFCNGNGACIHPNADKRPCEDDGNTCTEDVCVGGACVHLPRDPGWPCEDDGNECTEDVCAAGLCVHIPIPNKPCDDKDECTENDFCYTGHCSGILKDCSYLNIGDCVRGICVGPLVGCQAVDACVTPCPIVDYDEDGAIDGMDLYDLITSAPPPPAPITDLVIFSAGFGFSACP